MDQENFVRLEIDPYPESDTAVLMTSSSAVQSLRSALDEYDLRNRPTAFAGAETWLTAVSVLLGTGGLFRLVPALIAFIERNKEKRIELKIGDRSLEARGYAGKDFERILRAALETAPKATGSSNEADDSARS